MTISEKFLNHLEDLLLITIPKVLLGLVLLIIGTWLIRLFMRYLQSRFIKRDVDPSLHVFLSRLVKIALYIALFLSVAGTMGIKTTSFLAMLGGAGLAIGLALQGSLSNFAGGILILLFKPFRIGDYVSSTNDAAGTVEKIDILYTTLRTDKGMMVYAPNGPLANSVITNYSSSDKRKAEYSLSISYHSDIQKARQIILNVLDNDDLVLKTPAPEVVVNDIGPSSVQLLIRAWIGNANFWSVFYKNREAIKIALDQNEISIPLSPQEIQIVSPNTKPADIEKPKSGL